MKLKILVITGILVGIISCSSGPECIKSHLEQKWEYGYGYGYGYGYDPATGKTDYHYGYGYNYGYHTVTVCDAYASPKAS